MCVLKSLFVALKSRLFRQMWLWNWGKSPKKLRTPFFSTFSCKLQSLFLTHSYSPCPSTTLLPGSQDLTSTVKSDCSQHLLWPMFPEWTSLFVASLNATPTQRQGNCSNDSRAVSDCVGREVPLLSKDVNPLIRVGGASAWPERKGRCL